MFVVGRPGFEPGRDFVLSEKGVPDFHYPPPHMTRLEAYLRAGSGAESQSVLTTFDTSQTTLERLA
jgi:hypothetical protein